MAAKEGGGTADKDAAGCDVSSVLLPRSEPGRGSAFPDPVSCAATAGSRGNPMCVVWKSSRETVEASIPCSDHQDFERTLRSIAKFYDLRVISTNGLLPALDLPRFDAAPLTTFIAAKETNQGNETEGRIPR